MCRDNDVYFAPTLSIVQNRWTWRSIRSCWTSRRCVPRSNLYNPDALAG